MLIAIDGPSGAGKSSVARAVAAALDLTYLDSGAMYRAIALATLCDGDEHDAPRIARDAAIELGDRVLLDGRDVTAVIRTPEVSDAASRIAADPGVRAALVARQRALIAHGNWVAEGRDIGTVVAPDAALKVFLTASPHARARRRAKQLGVDVDVVLADQGERDARDEQRQHSPLRPAPGAVLLDTSDLSLEEVVARIASLAQPLLASR